MEFLTYPRITVSIAPGASRGGTFVATEKIHGANFVVGSDGTQTKFGKRKSWLEPDESFFGYQLLRDQLSESIRTIQRELNQTVYLYGELFGGQYPHPNVPNQPGLGAVQTGIWYSPDVCFATFDVRVVASERDVFLGWDDLCRLTEKSGLLTAPVVARGRLAELLPLKARRHSMVPAILGLPPIDENWAEGVVVKSAELVSATDRAIYKQKIEEFEEARFDESAKLGDVFLSAEALRGWMLKLINPARLASARSKVGEDRTKIAEEAAIDALLDLSQAFPSSFVVLNAEQESKLLTAAKFAALRLLES